MHTVLCRSFLSVRHGGQVDMGNRLKFKKINKLKISAADSSNKIETFFRNN